MAQQPQLASQQTALPLALPPAAAQALDDPQPLLQSKGGPPPAAGGGRRTGAKAQGLTLGVRRSAIKRAMIQTHSPTEDAAEPILVDEEEEPEDAAVAEQLRMFAEAGQARAEAAAAAAAVATAAASLSTTPSDSGWSNLDLLSPTSQDAPPATTSISASLAPPPSQPHP